MTVTATESTLQHEKAARMSAAITANDLDVDAVPILQDLLVPTAEELWEAMRVAGPGQRAALLSRHRACVDFFLATLLHHYPDSNIGAQAFLDVFSWRRRFATAFEATGLTLSRTDPGRAKRVRAFYAYRRDYADWVWSSPALHARSSEHGSMDLEVLPDALHDRPEYATAWTEAFGDLEIADYYAHFPCVEASEVALQLPEGSVLVEYWRADHFVDETGSYAPRYLAVALSAENRTQAQAVHLCTAEAADAQIEALMGANRAHRWSDSAAREIRELLFDPLPSFVHQATRLFIVPDGRLGLVPFATLPYGNGYLIDQMELSYLQSGQDLARPEPRLKPSAPVVIAAPAFDLADSSGSRYWGPLPGARAEGREIAARLNTEPIEGDMATAQALTSVVTPAVLHVATHGSFLPARPYIASIDPMVPFKEAETVWLFEKSLRRLAGRPVSYPELRSVLALAGANDWLYGIDLDPDFGRGHLTSEDLAGLNLEATRLVVLSACSTGTGETSPERGIVGFRSALAVAGARSLVMTLWEIGDDCTKTMMLDLYDDLSRGTSRSSALRSAQLALRHKGFGPLDWGAFILEGEAGPCDLGAGTP